MSQSSQKTSQLKNSGGAGVTVPCKRSKPSTSTPKRKIKVPKNQPKLINYLIDNNVNSVLKTPTTSTQQLHSEFSGNCEKHMYLLMLATKNDMSFIQPLIVKTSEIVYKPKDFMRCRINGSVYVGMLISGSKTLSSLESNVNSAVKQYAIGWKSNIIRSEMLIMSCTKEIKILEVEKDDQRVNFLSTILSTTSVENEILESDMTNRKEKGKNSGSIDQTNDEMDNNIHDEECEFMSDSQTDSEEKSASLAQDKIISIKKEFESPVIQDLENRNSNASKINDLSRDSGNCVSISSASDDEFDPTKIIPKKRRKRMYTDTKLLSKFREEKKNQVEEANVEIVALMNMVDEMIPTLPADNQLTPIIKKIYKFCQALNVKFNNINEKSIMENTIPLTRTVKIQKVKNEDEINFAGMMNFPIPEYAWSIEADSPRLVMSRIMRSCIPDSYKEGCTVNNAENDTNFLFRIGSETLNGAERVADGKEKLELLIEHAHAIKKLTSMTFHSYRDCKVQVDKALYDFTRNRMKKVGASQDDD